MKKVTFSQAPVGDVIKMQGKLYVMYSKEEVTRVNGEEEVIEYIAYVDPAITDNADDIAKRITKLEAALAKSKQIEALEKLTVTTSNGNEFDANIESRVNMADAILASEKLGLTESIWRLTDNTEVVVGITELKEAHALALQKYAETKAIGV